MAPGLSRPRRRPREAAGLPRRPSPSPRPSEAGGGRGRAARRSRPDFKRQPRACGVSGLPATGSGGNRFRPDPAAALGAPREPQGEGAATLRPRRLPSSPPPGPAGRSLPSGAASLRAGSPRRQPAPAAASPLRCCRPRGVPSPMTPLARLVAFPVWAGPPRPAPGVSGRGSRLRGARAGVKRRGPRKPLSLQIRPPR